MKFDSSCTSSLTRVVPKCTYCQKVVARIKRDCEVMDVSLWQERDYESLVRRHDQVFDCNCIRSIREFADNILMLTKNSHKQAKILIFFFLAVLKAILKFLYQKGKCGCTFFAVHRAMFSQQYQNP